MRHGQEKKSLAASIGKAVAGFAAVAAVGFGAAYLMAPKVYENEIGMKIVKGAIVDDSLESGVYMSALLPKTEIREFTRTLVTGTVHATPEDDATMRTADKLRVYGGFRFKFQLDDTHPDWRNAFHKLKANNADDMIDDIGDYLMPAAIDVYSNISSDDINANLTTAGGTGDRIKIATQETLDARDLGFIKLLDVIPTGMGLSPEADSLIEEQATESRKLSIDLTRRELAAQQKETIVDQAAVTVNALNAFMESGLSSDQALYALCLQQQRDAGVLDNAAPCIPSGSNTSVVACARQPAPATLANN